MRNAISLFCVSCLAASMPFAFSEQGAAQTLPISEIGNVITSPLGQSGQLDEPSIEAAPPGQVFQQRAPGPLQKGSGAMRRTSLQRADAAESAADLIDRIFRECR
jgi:hypothetical protein